MRFRIVEGANAIIGNGKFSKDGSSWDKDLDLNYKQVEQEERVHAFLLKLTLNRPTADEIRICGCQVIMKGERKS